VHFYALGACAIAWTRRRSGATVLLRTSGRDKPVPADTKQEVAHMYVVAIHSVSDPEAFWGGELEMPDGTTLSTVAPNSDGTRAVCVWESDSVDTVQRLVDGAAGEISENEFFAVNEATAQGLPA
jgi:hypothetical protein